MVSHPSQLLVDLLTIHVEPELEVSVERIDTLVVEIRMSRDPMEGPTWDTLFSREGVQQHL